MLTFLAISLGLVSLAGGLFYGYCYIVSRATGVPVLFVMSTLITRLLRLDQ
jgi:hypothetical protein